MADKYHVEFLDTFPGVGKTTEAIRLMVADRKSIHFYVAPTHTLCDQTKDRLLADGIPQELVVKIGKKNVQQKNGTTRLIVSVLDGGGTHSSTSSPCLPGTILVMTHQAFLQLPDLDRGSEIRVFFDEARKFILDDGTIRFANAEFRKAFSTFLVEFSVPVEDTEFRKVAIPKGCKPPAYLLSGDTTSDGQLTMHRHVKRFLASARNPKLDLYVKEQTTGDNKVSVHRVVVPSRAFRGFKSVLLLSAYFKDSQMYHLLNEDSDVILESIFRRRPKLAERILETEKRMQLRFRDVTLIPLMSEPKKISMDRIRSDMAIPRDKIVEICNLADTLGITLTGIQDATDQTGLTSGGTRKLRPNYAEFYAAVERSGGGPRLLTWCLEMASDVVSKIKGANRLCGNPLLVVNKKGHSLAQAEPFELPLGPFEMIPPASHGLNKYRECNVIAYLSANNPTPEMCKLFNALLPRYEPDKDHAADSCVQAVTRLSVRESTSSDKVYVILPDMGLAKLVEEKFNNVCRYNSSVTDALNMVSLATALGKRRMSSGGARGGAKGGLTNRGRPSGSKKVRSPDRLALDRKLASISAYISREKREGREGGARHTKLLAERSSINAKVKQVESVDNPVSR